MRLSVLASALVASLVGFGGTIAIVVAAARAVGADAALTSSWVAGLCLAMAGTSIWLSWRHRIPVITAWSTPGAALIAASGGMADPPAAIASFLLVGCLLLATALIRPLARLLERLPTPVAAAMLAGVLLPLVMRLAQAAPADPLLVLPLLLLFLAARPVIPGTAVLLVLVAGIALTGLTGGLAALPAPSLPSLVLVAPRFDPAVLVGLGLPLFLVTMAAQNLPGFAVLKAAGYPVPSRSILTATGAASLLTAPLGAHTSNLAAITAAICTGPETHPDPARRWQAGIAYGLCYLALAAVSGSLVELVAALPPALIACVAGIALLAPLAGALGGAFLDERRRVAAAVTLAVTASGVALLGVGSAFWGLLAGLLVLALERVAATIRR